MATTMILYGQLQEGLRLELIRSASVSGALTYKELCVSAKNEEHRQRELKKWQDYVKHSSHPNEPKKQSNKSSANTEPAKQVKPFSRPSYYNCGKPGHLARDYHAPKRESRGHPPGGKVRANTKQVESVSNYSSRQEYIIILYSCSR